ncbi:glycerol uptake facilitator [Pseudohyphozyma bogoriensis]|nr:glycerol uptake facilitator [Pseudohyphozyma bogoriensis]
MARTHSTVSIPNERELEKAVAGHDEQGGARDEGGARLSASETADTHHSPQMGVMHEPSRLSQPIRRLRNRMPPLVLACAAEFIGVFSYVLCGVGATATFFTTSVAQKSGFGDLFTIGLAYALGIFFGIVVAAPVSGGHLSPGFTIAFATFRRFPWKLIMGAFVAALVVYLQFKQAFVPIADQFRLAGNSALFGPEAPAGVLALFPTAGQGNGYLFWNELVATTFLSLIIHALIDHTNVFTSFTTAPFGIGLGYAVCIWAFATQTIALNTARDLGGRFAAACIYGSGAFNTYKAYNAIAAFTNILGTLIGAFIHLMFIADDSRIQISVHPQPSKSNIPVSE